MTKRVNIETNILCKNLKLNCTEKRNSFFAFKNESQMFLAGIFFFPSTRSKTNISTEIKVILQNFQFKIFSVRFEIQFHGI